MKKTLIRLCAESMRLVQGIDAAAALGYITKASPEEMILLISFLADLNEETASVLEEAIHLLGINPEDLLTINSDK